MTTHAREFTLRGYLDVIRRGRWLILAVALVAAAAAFGYSKLEKPTYTATSTLTVNDPNQAIAYTGSTYYSGLTPLQEAEVAAPQVTRPAVVRAVQKQLGPSATSGSVTASVDPNSYVIHLTATGRSATQTAALANAFANADVALSTAQARAFYNQQALAVARQLRHLSPTSPQGVTAATTLSRYQSLAVTATPLNVAAPATVPSSPSSPKTARNTIGALLVGLLLGIALATARDALDRRLRHSHEVSKVLDHPVIGRIRSEALGHAGSPAESSNGVGPLEATDQESFRILRQNIAYLGTATASRTVLVTSPVADEGKSTVAACLAVATAESGQRTLLVECDLRKPVLAKRFGIKRDPGLTDYLTGNAQPHEILQPVAGIIERLNGSGPTVAGNPPGGANLVCITAGSSVPRPAELLASERFRSFLTEVGDVYDTVILDSAPLVPVADTLGIVPDVSTVIVCIRLDKTTRDQAHAAQSALDRLPERPVGVVLTDVRQRDDSEYYGDYGAIVPA
jgi:succinoglycan biosynthesis transport protein ExoP